MIDNSISSRLNIIRFPLITGVVFIHMYTDAMPISIQDASNNPAAYISDFIRGLISQGICQTAVPIFFLMSGYLFFAVITWSREVYFAKLKRRVRTLLIPFLFWNMLVLLFYLAIQNIPVIQQYTHSGFVPVIADFNVFDYLNAVFGITHKPIAYQFWFIRDLMVLVLISPLIQILNKWVFAAFLGITSLCWFFQIWPVPFPRVDAVLFFGIGSFLSINHLSIFVLDKYGKYFVFVYIPVVILATLARNMTFGSYLYCFGVALGVFAALFLTSYITRKKRMSEFLSGLSGMAFFIFAAHEPLLSVLRRVADVLIPSITPGIKLILYFTLPFLVIAAAILVYKVLFRIAPKFLSIINGRIETGPIL
jgi:surface polysaccharide O-acyltransferase-like enzyme